MFLITNHRIVQDVAMCYCSLSATKRYESIDVNWIDRESFRWNRYLYRSIQLMFRELLTGCSCHDSCQIIFYFIFSCHLFHSWHSNGFTPYNNPGTLSKFLLCQRLEVLSCLAVELCWWCWNFATNEHLLQVFNSVEKIITTYRSCDFITLPKP